MLIEGLKPEINLKIAFQKVRNDIIVKIGIVRTKKEKK